MVTWQGSHSSEVWTGSQSRPTADNLTLLHQSQLRMWQATGPTPHSSDVVTATLSLIIFRLHVTAGDETLCVCVCVWVCESPHKVKEKSSPSHSLMTVRPQTMWLWPQIHSLISSHRYWSDTKPSVLICSIWVMNADWLAREDLV